MFLSGENGTNVDEKLELYNSMIMMVYTIFSCFSLINSCKWRGKGDSEIFFILLKLVSLLGYKL